MPQYEVKSGDSLWSIAKATGKDWLSVVAAYGGKDPNIIQPGDIINIPSGRASEGARSRAAVRVGVSATGRAADVGAFQINEQGNLVQTNFTPEVAAPLPAPELKQFPTSPFTGRRFGTGGDVETRTFTQPAQQLTQPTQLVSPYTGRRISISPQSPQAQPTSPFTGRQFGGEAVPVPGRQPILPVLQPPPGLEAPSQEVTATPVAGGRAGAPMEPQGPISGGFSVGGKMFHFQGYDQNGNPTYGAGGVSPVAEAQATLSYLDRLSGPNSNPQQREAAREFAQRRSRFGQSGGLGVQVWLTEQAVSEGRYPTYATERVFQVIAQRMGWQGTVQELMVYLGYAPAPADYGPGVWVVSGETRAQVDLLGSGFGGGSGGFYGGGYSGRSGGGGGGRRGPGFSAGLIDWRVSA